MPCFYVGGDDDKTGLGVAYASEHSTVASAGRSLTLTTALDEETLVGSYIPMDDNHRSAPSIASLASDF